MSAKHAYRKEAIAAHVMLAKQCQELVAELFPIFGPVVLQGLQLLAMPPGVKCMILTCCGSDDSCFHVLKLVCSLHRDISCTDCMFLLHILP